MSIQELEKKLERIDEKLEFLIKEGVDYLEKAQECLSAPEQKAYHQSYMNRYIMCQNNMTVQKITAVEAKLDYIISRIDEKS